VLAGGVDDVRRSDAEARRASPIEELEGVVHQTQARDRCDVDIYEIETKPGQVFITCSDGLSGMCEDRQIAKIIEGGLDEFEKLPQKLIDAANAGGGKDNITVLCSLVRG